MALTYSTQMTINTQAPYFKLLEPKTKNEISLSIQDLGSPVLVMFICNHCPYVQHLKSKLSEICRHYQKMGFKIFAINSNDTQHYPDDSPENMIKDAEDFNYSFPYLFDKDQSVARAYRAACTPEFFVFDREHKLKYCGQFDASRPSSKIEVSGSDLKKALDAVYNKQELSSAFIASMGCNIKLITF